MKLLPHYTINWIWYQSINQSLYSPHKRN